MTSTKNNFGYRSIWDSLFVCYREGYYTPAVDFHEHEFYEINLILSGNVKVLLSDHVEEGTQSRIVLTRPGTPHFISCKPDALYSRLYLLFSKDFIADYIPEWKKMISVFGKNGKIVNISAEQTDFCKTLIERIQEESEPFRQRLLILYLLSYIAEFARKKEDINYTEIPPYVMGALTYINEHYSEKIIASELAWKLNIGRTTLMTSFKKYTGSTLNNYLNQCRLKKAVELLHEGKTEQEVAEICGFNDSCNLIRNFKRYFGMTPRQYLLKEKSEFDYIL